MRSARWKPDFSHTESAIASRFSSHLRRRRCYPVVRESIEMLYQLKDDYRFDSSRVEKAFGLTATTYRT